MWTGTGKFVGDAQHVEKAPRPKCRVRHGAEACPPRPPGTRGFGPGLVHAPWRHASVVQTPATAYSQAVSPTLTTQANASPSPSPNPNANAKANPTPHHPGSLSAFEKECLDKYDIRIDEQVALSLPLTRNRT